MTYTRHKQECTCGNDTYHLQLLLTWNGSDIVASCSDCGRITGSIGESGRNGLHGKDINEVVDE